MLAAYDDISQQQTHNFFSLCCKCMIGTDPENLCMEPAEKPLRCDVLKAFRAAQCSGHIPDVTSTLVKDMALSQCLITYATLLRLGRYCLSKYRNFGLLAQTFMSTMSGQTCPRPKIVDCRTFVAEMKQLCRGVHRTKPGSFSSNVFLQSTCIKQKHIPILCRTHAVTLFRVESRKSVHIVMSHPIKGTKNK